MTVLIRRLRALVAPPCQCDGCRAARGDLVVVPGRPFAANGLVWLRIRPGHAMEALDPVGACLLARGLMAAANDADRQRLGLPAAEQENRS